MFLIYTISSNFCFPLDYVIIIAHQKQKKQYFLHTFFNKNKRKIKKNGGLFNRIVENYLGRTKIEHMRLVNVKKSRGQRPQTYNTVMLSSAERSEERGRGGIALWNNLRLIQNKKK